jgi:hypothetical protein
MKTTVNISDSLLREVRKVAAREGVTLRVLIERGLHHVLREAKGPKPLRLRRASFRGEGLRPERSAGSWKELRDLAYENHGS